MQNQFTMYLQKCILPLQALGCHITEIKRHYISQLISSWHGIKKERGNCHCVSVLPSNALPGLFYWKTPSSVPHIWVAGLLCATMRAHQVFDVSIPLLQNPGCHGNTPGWQWQRKLQWREERAKGGGQLARPLLWAFFSLWPSLLINLALAKDICWRQAKSRTV